MHHKAGEQRCIYASRKAAHRVLAAVLCAAAAGGVLLGLGWPRAEAEPAAVAAASYEWGLSFQTENEPPIPNLSAEKLRPFDAFYCGDAEQKRLYLTFDAGYENGNTAPILDALKKHNAPGTFFVVGSYIKGKPGPDQADGRRRPADGGGNHTYHHPNMSQKDEASFKKELNDLAALFQETTGTPLPLFYRPPEGKFSDENLTWAQELGYKTIFWEPRLCGLETGCTAFAGLAAFDKLMPRTHDGAIVLLHSTSATNAAILDELLTRWEEMGYTFGTLSELGAPPAAPAA